ncbi:bifunctional lysine-specific demethylase andhistidyl-hydroxylase NO66 [Striga asiatica]|uniref:Bifunctional lysine-specific demethylase and histidyl-hydroxylase n=1 Tax=Striga asiatica TaxID=4170 RepID=A0A5A7PJ33_STRAF|nr:bifunctional lysine-specific demethylase andhistidyl-hydroxylase NO66 [Striga asiatica]
MKRGGRMVNNKKNKKTRINTELEATFFPFLLAAICSKSQKREDQIMKCLNRVFLSLPQIDLSPILAMLPSLLKFKNCRAVVCKAAEIAGAASLSSLEMNEKVCLDDEIVTGLISLLGSSEEEIAMASCNAVLDLSTTLIGRQRLLEFGAVDNLLLRFMQACKFQKFFPIGNMKLVEKDEYPLLLLQGAITLINSCTIEQLEHLPIELTENFSKLLKRIWRQEREERIFGPASMQGDEFCLKNIKTSNLVESIFRLSINCNLHPETIDFKPPKKSDFYFGKIGIEPFLSDIWETSPMLIRNSSNSSLNPDSIFGAFIQFLGLKDTIPTFLPSFLKRIISCPAIASDELDILQVIKDINNNLGHPINYHQDIRVVKTEHGGKELHYFPNPHVLTIDDIEKCEEAFKKGYSIAVRGIEFRDPSIAAIADELAFLFGQPSAGVNMYLTPFNSQGLARHSDDHCVIVCQIVGAKRWRVFSQSDFKLPRLYESCCSSLDDLEDESCEFDECRQFVVKRGDVLYIPRGFPHEATTDVDEFDNVSNGASLHLTLAIEVEPPFEWEGFMHTAIYSWDKKFKASLQACSLHVISIMLLHIAIKLIGQHDLRYRKACLALSSHTNDWLCENQRTNFGHLISIIDSKVKFLEAVEHFKAALEMNEDPLEHVRWMKFLEVPNLYILSTDSQELFGVLSRDKDLLEASFSKVKSRFCREVEFEDVKQCYQVLLGKYRKVRKQYTNGMLALHSAIGDDECEFHA